MSEMLEFADGGEGVKNVSGIAYSGGEIMQWGEKVIVDLDGMTFAQQIPLLVNHVNAPEYKIGEVKCEIRNGRLMCAGTISAKTDRAREIVENGSESKWQLSIGASVKRRRFVGEDETMSVNGRKFSNGMVVEKSVLREISVVAVGADEKTSMTIAAALDVDESFLKDSSDSVSLSQTEQKGGSKMAEVVNGITEAEVNARIQAALENAAKKSEADMEAKIQAALETENKRVLEIKKVCNNEYPDIEMKAISEKMTVADATAMVLEAMRKSRPATGVNVMFKESEKSTQSSLESALCLRLGFNANELAAQYGEKEVETAEKMRGIELKELIREVVAMDGGTVSRLSFGDSDIRAAFSTVSLPGILSNVANKQLLKSFNAVEPVAYRLCSIGNLQDFKEAERYRLSDLGDLQPIAPDGNFPDSKLAEESAKNQLDTYGKKFCLTRKMIINDDLGAFVTVPSQMGKKSARLVDKLFISRLEANPTQPDGQALFSAAHRNLISSNTFSRDALKAAVSLFNAQVDLNGDKIGAKAKFVFVPDALELDAREVIDSQSVVIAGSTDATKPAFNVLSRLGLEVVSSALLTSDSNWYLFGNPDEIDTFEIGFLKGNRTPYIQQGDTDYNSLGMWFRVFFDVGVREQDHRGVEKNA